MTKIEWTDRTWNPTTGCNKVSPGCKNCYAEKQHKRMMHMHPQKYTNPFSAGVQTHDDVLTAPLRWKKPQRIFVNSMSDLFHEDVPANFILKVFVIMAQCKQHTFQILTKRPERMKVLLDEGGAINAEQVQDRMTNYDKLPLPNVWLGVSCENQQTADERIPLLLQTPAAVRFLSCEPLLGEINLNGYLPDVYADGTKVHPYWNGTGEPNQIHWVIVGGESGSNARPMHPDWARSLRDQCLAAGVPFFFKQWGEWLPWEQDAQPPFWKSQNGQCVDGHQLNIIDPQTGEASKGWDDGMWCVAEELSDCSFQKVGKKAAGNLLDGVAHHEFPTTQKLQEA